MGCGGGGVGGVGARVGGVVGGCGVLMGGMGSSGRVWGADGWDGE